jgi:threonylcarbamoyladenosine tRNA methylthiotransferase MtaB
MNRFYIKTLGCKVNQYESQVIRENLLKAGYVEASSKDEADICVVNTCKIDPLRPREESMRYSNRLHDRR